MVVIGDFNTKSSNWHSKDNTSNEGRIIEAATSRNGLHQEINELAHILDNSSSCIDLIFNSQPKLIIESNVHLSWNPSCYHQIIYLKFNSDIAYPPPYKRELWHYQKVNIDLITRAINEFDCKKEFPNIDVDKVVYIFNKIVINILWIFLFLMRQSCLMTETLFGWTRKWKNWLMKKNNNFFKKLFPLK